MQGVSGGDSNKYANSRGTSVETTNSIQNEGRLSGFSSQNQRMDPSESSEKRLDHNESPAGQKVNPSGISRFSISKGNFSNASQ